jgi:hypothetical protein
MCAKYKMKITGDTQYINVPLSQTQSNVGQEDIIEHEFVEKEVAKSINEVVDYEKYRLTPSNNGDIVERVDYQINLLDNGNFPNTTTLKTIGFTNDDLKFRKKSFKKSFLNLLFFDSDSPTKQNLLSHTTIYNRTSRFDMMGTPDDSIEPINETQEEEPIFKLDTNFSWGSNELGENITVGTVDDSITEGLFLGQACLSVVDMGSLSKHFVKGLSYKTVISIIPSWESCDDYPEIYVGAPVNGTEVKIPHTFLDSIYLADSNYFYNGKRYKVYTKWSTNFFIKKKGLVGVYFEEIVSGEGNDVGTTDSTNPILYGKLKDVNEIPLKFIVENPISKPRGFSEGYHLYSNINHLPSSIYMRANYNNAKTGVSTDLVTTDQPCTIEEVISKLHTKYDLKLIGDNYCYELDTEYSNNIQVGDNKLMVNLFEIQVI